MAERLVLHIGAMKTGTTFLQSALAANRAVLEELATAAVDQHILDRAPGLDGLFAPGTHELAG